MPTGCNAGCLCITSPRIMRNAPATSKSMTLQNFLGGTWTASTASSTVPVHNPSTGEVIAETPLSPAADVEAAVAAARLAFEHWGQTPAPKRAAVLFRYRELLEQEFEALARLVTRE